MKPTFKKVILFSTLVVLIGVVMFFALGYSQTPLTVQGSSNGLQLTMTLEQTEYSLGEPINMKFTVTNISPQTITLVQCTGTRFDFRVYNDKNNTVYEQSHDYHVNPGGPVITSPSPIISLSSTTLNAEESLTGVVVWGQMSNSTAFPVSSGTYYIVGQISMLSGINGLTIETTPVQVTIV